MRKGKINSERNEVRMNKRERKKTKARKKERNNGI